MPEKGGPPDPELLRLGLQIRQAREELKLSVEAMAERSGLSARGLLYIEHGRRNPSYLTLLAIAKGLGTTVSELSLRSVRKPAVKPAKSVPKNAAKRRKS